MLQKIGRVTLCLSFTLFALGVSESPKPGHLEGAWVAQGVPKIRVEVDSGKKKVQLSLIKPTNRAPRSVGLTFIDSQGNKRLIELRALSPEADQIRYQATLSKAESFIGFEVKIPFSSQKPTVIKSEEMIQEK